MISSLTETTPNSLYTAKPPHISKKNTDVLPLPDTVTGLMIPIMIPEGKNKASEYKRFIDLALIETYERKLAKLQKYNFNSERINS